MIKSIIGGIASALAFAGVAVAQNASANSVVVPQQPNTISQSMPAPLVVPLAPPPPEKLPTPRPLVPDAKPSLKPATSLVRPDTGKEPK